MNQKKLMAEAALLYYEKNFSQQTIAKILNLSRQTVSKYLSDALQEGIVEIKIHDPEDECLELSAKLCHLFRIKNASVCSVSKTDEDLMRLFLVRHAIEYLLPSIKKGDLNIALSWGRTILTFINELPIIQTKNNTVFPLLGSTDWDTAYYMPNEFVRNFSEKTGATAKYAWFPFNLDTHSDCDLFIRTKYYQKIQKYWQNIDLAIVGIGNNSLNNPDIKVAYSSGLYGNDIIQIRGDIATHYFKINGSFIPPKGVSLCASVENLKAAKQVVAIAGGPDKVEAISGALRTGIISCLITDEQTARTVINLAK